MKCTLGMQTEDRGPRGAGCWEGIFGGWKALVAVGVVGTAVRGRREGCVHMLAVAAHDAGTIGGGGAMNGTVHVEGRRVGSTWAAEGMGVLAVRGAGGMAVSA